MGYKIYGDGSYSNTKVEKDNELIEWNYLFINIEPKNCFAETDTGIDDIDSIVLRGVYGIIGQGEYHNTKVFLYDEEMRGLQRFHLNIEENKGGIFEIGGVFLPNIVGVEE